MRLYPPAWLITRRAAEEDAESRREALGRLLVRYLPPLRAHLVYRKGLQVDRADDLLQDVAQDRHRIGDQRPALQLDGRLVAAQAPAPAARQHRADRRVGVRAHRGACP